MEFLGNLMTDSFEIFRKTLRSNTIVFVKGFPGKKQIFYTKKHNFLLELTRLYILTLTHTPPFWPVYL